MRDSQGMKVSNQPLCLLECEIRIELQAISRQRPNAPLMRSQPVQAFRDTAGFGDKDFRRRSHGAWD